MYSYSQTQFIAVCGDAAVALKFFGPFEDRGAAKLFVDSMEHTHPDLWRGAQITHLTTARRVAT